MKRATGIEIDDREKIAEKIIMRAVDIAREKHFDVVCIDIEGFDDREGTVEELRGIGRDIDRGAEQERVFVENLEMSHRVGEIKKDHGVSSSTGEHIVVDELRMDADDVKARKSNLESRHNVGIGSKDKKSIERCGKRAEESIAGGRGRDKVETLSLGVRIVEVAGNPYKRARRHDKKHLREIEGVDTLIVKELLDSVHHVDERGGEVKSHLTDREKDIGERRDRKRKSICPEANGYSFLVGR